VAQLCGAILGEDGQPGIACRIFGGYLGQP
jgi:hypothetical protein